MIKDYQGCKNHTNCVNWDCPSCITEIKKQQEQDENDNHSDSEEFEFIINQEIED